MYYNMQLCFNANRVVLANLTGVHSNWKILILLEVIHSDFIIFKYHQSKLTISVSWVNCSTNSEVINNGNKVMNVSLKNVISKISHLLQ